MILVPPTVIASERPFSTPCVVSEPTPASWRNVGAPLGSACATPLRPTTRAAIATVTRVFLLLTSGILFAAGMPGLLVRTHRRRVLTVRRRSCGSTRPVGSGAALFQLVLSGKECFERLTW